ncbi:MAG: endonuclease/exonuclease/phosphatase family protein, partial [Flavobacteriales bacterium]
WMLNNRYRWMGGSTILAALLVLLPPARMLQSGKEGRSSVALWSIAQMNINETSTAVVEVLATARSSDADLLSLQEVDEHWMDALVAGLSDLYPWHIHRSGERNYGIALFSKNPLEQAEVFDLEGLPAIRAQVSQQGRRVQILAVHLRAPESAAKLAQRNAQWNSLAKTAGEEKEPVCLIGDLNTVPWDNAFEQFLTSTSMSIGPDPLIPTWPVLAGTAVIPLDHILISSELRVDGMKVFNIPGSDHRGLWARVELCE